MPTYTVRIETSVSIEATTAQEASEIAQCWAEESLPSSNAIVTVYQQSAKNKIGKKVLTQAL